MNATIVEYADDPERFKKLELEEQLAIIADIILYWADKEVEVLRAGHKERHPEFREVHNRTKYWESLQTNIRRAVEVELTKVRKGV